ncbi:SGNH/GDSL hydrolase family protein [Sinisalibacter aestuarii]|uniref:Lipase n=1 Tax=Sinisalibacter aestuarii TaxID=2949426 RepID=A0ABQ5LSA0_9RHOB|nr:SGNH/GDSL hydrolase family protein [Sinisalibacter aestuarii]GKY87280.1 lipase [Sinisalibacter aestuarii]
MAFDTALKLALAPLLVAQGVGVRRRALVLPEPSGPRSGELGDGPPLSLLILGDSSAAGVGAPTQGEALAGQLTARLASHHRVRWRLVARSGDTTANALARLQNIPAEPFDLAVIALGVNDVTHSVPLARWLARQAELRARLTERFAVRHIIQSGLPPMGAFPALPQPLRAVMGLTARRFDAALAGTLADLPDAAHLRFNLPLTRDLMAPDGFHPSPAGYALWAETLAPALRAAALAG